MAITDITGSFTLNNGLQMPYLGLGVYECDNNEEVINAIHWALEAGYRHVDTAALYYNEEGVGKAIRQAPVDREDIFVVSKVWNADQGYEQTIKAFDTSLRKLKMDYLDLYLIHWPVKNKFVDTWRALEYLYRQGRIRAIGVSNFLQYQLEELLVHAEIKPMVNQMEFHPYLVQQDLIDFCQTQDIQYEAWSPLMRKGVLDIAVLKELAEQYQKTIPQIVVRWDLQKGIITIPKSANKNRIAANADVFDFELSTDDMERINQLDRHARIGPDPASF